MQDLRLIGVHEDGMHLILGDGAPRRSAELKADFVGSLHNAAIVIAGLHRGEKRLVESVSLWKSINQAIIRALEGNEHVRAKLA